MHAPSTLLLTLLATFASATPLASRQAARALDCSNPNDDNKTFLSDSGILYTLQCATDYRNGDLSSSTQPTLNDCVNSCDATAGCISSVYAGKTCYLKKQIFESSSNPGVATAKRVFINSLCQPDQGDKFLYPTIAGPALYRVGCKTDYFGGDILAVAGNRLEDCIQTCSTTSKCVGATFHNDQCYLKSSFDGVRTSTSASSAVKAIDCLTGSSNGFVYPFPSGNKFTVKCGTTQIGGDILLLPTITVEDCISACDQKAGCSSITWTGGLCRLKRNVPGALTLNSPVYWSAFAN